MGSLEKISGPRIRLGLPQQEDTGWTVYLPTTKHYAYFMPVNLPHANQ